jgi:hypothetical protein
MQVLWCQLIAAVQPKQTLEHHTLSCPAGQSEQLRHLLLLETSSAVSPAVALTGGQANSCLCHCICNVLRQRLRGVTNAQADDLSIGVLLLMSAATPGNL